MNAPFVIKFGGSLAAGGQLRGWLDALLGGAGHAVLVPGGGPFADAVRAAQTGMGYDDVTAHRLALAAMRQYGLALASLEPQLVPVASHAALRRALRDGRIPVWLPETMVLQQPAIAASWTITSDSLALWLARHLHARGLVLVKQVRPGFGDVASLAARGVVDRAFPEYLAHTTVPAFIAGPGDRLALGAALRTGHMGELFAIHA